IVAATYSGDSSYAGSSGSLLGGQEINKAGTSLTVSSSANPSLFGQNLVFTATITIPPPGAGTPTGTVQFRIDGNNVGEPLNLNSALGVITASLSMPSLSVGTHTVTAWYSGDANFAGSITNLPGGQTVSVTAGTATTTTLISGLNATVFGQTVVFTATVGVPPGSGTPTGTVQFLVDGSPIGKPVTVSTSSVVA